MFARYSQFGLNLVTDDGTTFLSGVPYVEFEYSGPEELHEIDITEIGRPDLVAWKRLGDPSYWPFICWYNNIQDPLLGFNNVRIVLDGQGLPLYDLNGNIVLEPNVIYIPTDTSQFIKGVIPRAYLQDAS